MTFQPLSLSSSWIHLICLLQRNQIKSNQKTWCFFQCSSITCLNENKVRPHVKFMFFSLWWINPEDHFPNSSKRVFRKQYGDNFNGLWNIPRKKFNGWPLTCDESLLIWFVDTDQGGALLFAADFGLRPCQSWLCVDLVICSCYEVFRPVISGWSLIQKYGELISVSQTKLRFHTVCRYF